MIINAIVIYAVFHALKQQIPLDEVQFEMTAMTNFQRRILINLHEPD